MVEACRRRGRSCHCASPSLCFLQARRESIRVTLHGSRAR
jgi:hypothetical protein